MGPLLRLALIAIAIWLVIRFVRRWLSGPATPQIPVIDDVVPCAHCGTYVPKSAAIRADGLLFCSQQHANKEKRPG